MKKFTIYAAAAATALTLMGTAPLTALAASKNCSPSFRTVILKGGSGLFPGCIPSAGGGSQGSQNGGSHNSSNNGSNNSGNNSGANNGTNSGSNSSNDAAYEDPVIAEVLSLVNSERAKAGLAPLTLNSNVTRAAQTRADEIRTSFSHTRPDGKSFSTALTEAGVSYRSCGENIASGQRSAAQVMSGWMNSAGHRANILSSSYTEIGIGHIKDASGTDYWVQLFIR